MQSPSLPALLRYGAAATVVISAVFVRLALDPVLGDLFPFATLFFAVLIVAGYGGRGPALLATGLGALASARILLPPRDGFALQGVENRAGMVLYLAVGTGIALLGGALREARRRAERDADEALRQREQLRTTLASIGDAVLVTDAEGRVTSMNPVAEALTGWTSGEAAGRPLPSVFRIVNEETRREVEDPARRALREGVIVGLANHTVLIARDGSERAIDDSAAPVRGVDGIAGAVLVFRDVTGRRQSEKVLAEGERRLRMALDAARMVAWEWNPADGSLHVSENAADVFGLPRGTTLIRIDQGLKLVHPDDIASYRKTYQEAIEGRESYLIHYRLVRPDDGTVLWMEERGQAVSDESGEVVRLVGVAMDITDRRRAEEGMREARSRLDAILAASEIGTWEFDVAGDIIRADDQFVRMFAVSPEVAAGGTVESYIEAIHPDDRTLVSEAFGHALRSGGKYKAEFRVVGQDGIERWIMARGQFQGDSPGDAGRFPGVVVDITGEKRAGEELRLARSRLESTLSAGEVGTWEFDAVNNVVRADRNLARMFGVTDDEAAGGPIESYTRAIHPDDRGRVTTAIGRALECGEGFEEEYRLVGPGGAVRWVVARGRVEKDEAGRDVRLPGVVVDITGRKHAEEEHARLVAASEQQRRIYETALSSTPDFAYVFDLDGRFTYVNAALLGLWRKGLNEAVGKDFFDLGYPPDLAARLHRQIRQVIETKEPVRDETPFTSHLGERQYEYIFVPVLGAGGTVEAVAGSTRDITERKRAEERLRRSEADLADFFENATVGLHWVGPDGTILRANRAELEFLGYAEAEYVGSHIAGFHDDQGVIGDILGRLQAGQVLHDYPARLRCKDGSLKDVMIDSSVLWEDGRFVHTRCFTRDVTEARRAEGELRAAKEEADAANRAKTQFLAVLSHELRTPLNPILLAASSMLDRPCEPEEVRPTLEMIRQNVNLQARLIDDLLDVMRIVQGKMPLHWEVADCHRVIDRAVQICRSEVSGHDLRLTVEPTARQHHVNADAARLQQVLWNLIKNAVKFTPEGGTITVRTRNEGGDGEDRIVVEVIDTGIGIEPEVLPTIWDPFQQGETTITRKFGGLGLGLAICKGVVEAHGGILEAESPGKDRGTTFRLVLKALPEQAIEGNGRPVGDGLSVEPHQPSSLRILVVEDEPATLRLMARLLRGLGHAVTTANSIASGYEAFEAGEFDLIVSDIGLPDGTGLELMRRVVALRGRVPAIALTGYGMEEDIKKSRAAGFSAHMTKPIDFTKLGAMIGQVAGGVSPSRIVD